MDLHRRTYKGFGIKNILLIAFTIGALSYAVTLQHPASGAPSQPLLGFGVDEKTLSVASFSNPQPSELASAVDFNTGTLKSDYVQQVYAQAGSSSTGSVLGAATYNTDLANQFKDIPIQTLSNTAADNNVALQTYALQLSALTQNAHVTDLMNLPQTAVLTSQQKTFLANLQKIAVPGQLADYHRLLIGYYGLIFLQKQGSADASTATTIPEVAAQLDIIQHGLQTGSNVNLPSVPRR